jgi:hypothetical protein
MVNYIAADRMASAMYGAPKKSDRNYYMRKKENKERDRNALRGIERQGGESGVARA